MSPKVNEMSQPIAGIRAGQVAVAIWENEIQVNGTTKTVLKASVSRGMRMGVDGRRESTGPRQAQPDPELSLPLGGPEVKRMRRCMLCGSVERAELLGVYCGWCDRIGGDVQAGPAIERGLADTPSHHRKNL